MTVTINESKTKMIIFQLIDKEYAISVHQIRSIEKFQHFTRVPKTQNFVKGVINLRGVVTPIIDLRSRFGLPTAPPTENTRIIIAGLGDKEVGLIVDAANDVLDIATTSIEPQPEVVGTIEAEYISGVAKYEQRLLNILHLEKVLE